MEFNLSNYKIRVSESLNSIHFYILDKEENLLDTYSVEKQELEESKGIKDLKLKSFPTLKTIKTIKKID